jgi:hypothetical protein
MYYRILALGLAFFSFFMAALVSRAVFDRLPHLEDELAYVYQAKIFANGDVIVPTPDFRTEEEIRAGAANYARRAFWQPFVLDYTVEECPPEATDCIEQSNRFGKYAPGWPLLLSLGVNLGQMWILNAFFAMLTVALTYRLGAEIFKPSVGLVAAALVAFSPMALLLNATLMSHSSALFCFTLFMYAFWRIERGHHALRWGLIAGIVLGLIAIGRPSTAIGVSFPFIVWSGFKVLRSIYRDVSQPTTDAIAENARPVYQTPALLRPLLALSAVAILTSAALPLFNYSATGDPTQNLYTLVWWYDRLGFGECCGFAAARGEGGHTIVKGIRHTRFDLSLLAADLYGWNMQRADNTLGWEPGEITPALQEHLRTSQNYWPLIGLSFFIIPVGLMVGFKTWWLRVWLIGALYWLLYPLIDDAGFLRGVVTGGAGQSVETSQPLWRWLALGAGWWLLPFFGLIFNYREPESAADRSTRWTWLLFGVFVSLIGLQLAYWVGSQRYSTRYYFESLTAIALVSALGFVWLINGIGTIAGAVSGRRLVSTMREAMRRRSTTPIDEYSTAIRAGTPYQVGRMLGFGLLFTVLLWSLYAYSTPRIEALHRFNYVDQEFIDAIEARRVDDRDVLVLLNGESGTVRWRAYGSLMALTGPYQDEPIIGAWNYDPDNPAIREQLVSQFADRQLIEMAVYEESAWFIDDECADGEHVSVSPDCDTVEVATGD